MDSAAVVLTLIAFAYVGVEWISILALRPLARRLGVEVGRFRVPNTAIAGIATGDQVGLVVSSAGPNLWLFRPVMTWERLRIGRYGPLELCFGEVSRESNDATVSVRAPIGFSLCFGLIALGILLDLDRRDGLWEWLQAAALFSLGPTVTWFGSRRAALDLLTVAGVNAALAESQ